MMPCWMCGCGAIGVASGNAHFETTTTSTTSRRRRRTEVVLSRICRLVQTAEGERRRLTNKHDNHKMSVKLLIGHVCSCARRRLRRQHKQVGAFHLKQRVACTLMFPLLLPGVANVSPAHQSLNQSHHCCC